MPKVRRHAPGNAFGLGEALAGLAVGFILSYLAVSVYLTVRGHHASATSYGADVASLIGLWAGLLGAMVFATRTRAVARPADLASPAGLPPTAPGQAASRDHEGLSGALVVGRGTGSLVEDYGVRIRLLLDLPLGVAVGVASQYLLVPALEAPLQPFVPHLSQRLGHPAQQLLGNAGGSSSGLALLAVLVCLGSPVVEELFFRGLLLRALLGRLAGLGRRWGPALSIVITGVVFGLVHFEALQFLGLAGFGMVLGLLAWWTGRLGPSIFAHMAFNTTTVIVYALSR